MDQCVASLLGQTFDDFEVIIIDDASTDDTLVKAQSLARTDSRITVVSQPYNMGAHLVRKRGAEMASGEWIVLLMRTTNLFRIP
nr:Glycos_transf_2 [uncultured Clostridium sp.]